MLAGGGDLPQKFLQIKLDDKFFSRLLSKESSASTAEASFRVLYYGGAGGAVPFVWESQPGTPKHPFSGHSLLPLTPPPSFQSSPKPNKSMRKSSIPRFPFRIFRRVTSRESLVSPEFSSSSSRSSSSYASSSTGMIINPFRRWRLLVSRSRSSVVHLGGDDGGERATDMGSPSSPSCFGFRHVQ
ncbi:uncharacterized protein LOC127788486 [Diospyros lotus]|uniref:uncharacterized protein LOC127788486 n=1 Tax=Diospyros lotus TaxID=55363 RepID=UPI00225B29EB|nr:uncharacterized protein LOC127788486 [Diospyros lotus]